MHCKEGYIINSTQASEQYTTDYISIFRVHYTTSCNTQSSASEDGWDQHPKQVELIGIINKPLSLHLVGVYIIYINDARSNKYQSFCLLGIC